MSEVSLRIDSATLDADMTAFRLQVERLLPAHALELVPLVDQLGALQAERKLFTYRADGVASLVLDWTDPAREIVQRIREIEWRAEREARSLQSPPRAAAGGVTGSTPGGGVARSAADVRRPSSSWPWFVMARIVRRWFPGNTSTRKGDPT